APVEDVVDQVSDSLADAADPVVDIVDEVADSLAGSADGAIQDIADGAGDVTDGVNDAIADVTDQVTGGASDLGDSLLDSLLPDSGSGDNPLVEVDLALSTGDSAAGDTSADGEGALLDINGATPLSSDDVGGGGYIDELLSGSDAEVSVGGGETIDVVEVVDESGLTEVVPDTGLVDEGALDVDGVLDPISDAVSDATDLLDGLGGDADLSIDISDTGDVNGDLISDLTLDSGLDDAAGDILGGSDLPEPDVNLTEGLPLVDDSLGSLGHLGGGLFG
ncbi:MAG: hypothetical protein KDA48_02995, partial [Amphiplicatus sp.]|nr:hypothetical protein [Amphiplicatus sp.]